MVQEVSMCASNPRNCALRDNHSGPCLSAYELNKLVEKKTKELIKELEKSEA